jgi:hypothetical protein
MNINRQQQISLASVQSKSLTSGAAIASSNARNMAVSNLNRLSNATNPWRRNMAQQALGHNWLEYQDNLVEQASGQTTERRFFREALGQVKAAPANLLQKSNLQSADYSIDPAEPTNEDIYAIGAELFEEVPKGGGEEGQSESLSAEQIGAMEREAPRVRKSKGARLQMMRDAGIPISRKFLEPLELKPGIAFDPNKESGLMFPSYMLQEAKGLIASGTSNLQSFMESKNLNREEAIAFLLNPQNRQEIELASGLQSQQQSMMTRGGIADALLAYEQGGREFARYRQTTLLQPELFEEFRAEVRQEPIYEAEALEQGVLIDFGVDDQTTLRRAGRGRRRATPKTLPIAGQAFAENLFFQQSAESGDNAFDAGLPSQQYGGAAVAYNRELTIDELLERGLAEIQDYDERTDFISFANRYPSKNKEQTLRGFREEKKMQRGMVQGGSVQGSGGFEGRSVKTFSLFD